MTTEEQVKVVAAFGCWRRWRKTLDDVAKEAAGGEPGPRERYRDVLRSAEHDVMLRDSIERLGVQEGRKAFLAAYYATDPLEEAELNRTANEYYKRAFADLCCTERSAVLAAVRSAKGAS